MFVKVGVVARKKHLCEEILKMFAKVGVVGRNIYVCKGGCCGDCDPAMVLRHESVYATLG